jgi:hypothetical protein
VLVKKSHRPAREQPMDIDDLYEHILRIEHTLGYMQGELVEIRKLSERVAMLEQWQSWLKGAWAILAIGFAYVYRGIYQR